ncbi:hypothetical protein [Bradyrhizobium sp. 87]|uniref:hypothetical protein n=1 Tax=Bradyrhizobium sp. 87 TaxID=2782682 RepID=UPI001FF9C963|nr:hypothetical protein [Bradyrhizobium sp. 87]MCK1425877.1 hypothetical protein [Bradyrhizobium sp. 87]
MLLLPVAANAKAKFDPQICVGNGLCHVNPNGDIEMHISGPPHCYYIIATKDWGNPTAKPIISTCAWDNCVVYLLFLIDFGFVSLLDPKCDNFRFKKCKAFSSFSFAR